jgi:UDP-N-acetylmuramate--alanine ligase
VVQPHRYTRLRRCSSNSASCFNDADIVIVADTYAAGEAPIAGADREGLIQGLKAHGHRHVVALQTPAELAVIVHGLARPGDYVVCLGAGSITAWAYALPGELAALDGAPG